MDGHILIVSGIFSLLAYRIFKDHRVVSGMLALCTAVSMLVYIGVIFPFLKSFGTMLLSVALLVVSIRTIWF